MDPGFRRDDDSGWDDDIGRNDDVGRDDIGAGARLDRSRLLCHDRAALSASMKGTHMATDLAFLGLVELGKRLARGSLSPVEATRTMLERIERLDPTLKSYALVLAEPALRDAKRAEGELKKGRRKGPLHGGPIAVKDLCDLTGTPTGAGIPGFRSRRAAGDATVVTRLKAAGAVILGKLQLTEGALGLHHPEVPPPVIPWRADRWSGASSSGSGVATAAGLCYGSLGSDTGGSVRLPPPCKGPGRLKPTLGPGNPDGGLPLAQT